MPGKGRARMKFSAAIYSMTDFSNDKTRFFDALQAIKECGFDRVMLLTRRDRGPILTRGHLPDGCLVNLVESDVDIVEGQLMRAGIAPRVVFAAGIDVQQPPSMHDNRGWLRQICRAAEELGCHYIGHSVGRADRPGMDSSEKSNQIAALAGIIEDVASQFPAINFAADIHYQGVLETIADCELYLDELSTPNAGILVNTGHLTTCDQPGWELAEKYPERTPICAWKDHTEDPEGQRPFLSVQLGEGDTPLQEYVKVMKPQICDRAHVIGIESASPAQRRSVLQQSREYLEDLWDRTQVQHT